MKKKASYFKTTNNEPIFCVPYFPVGSIIPTVNSANPSTYWKYGKWQLIAEGMTLVGVNPDDSDFNEPEKTGGEKEHKLTIDEMPNHRHNGIFTSFGGERTGGYGTSGSHTGIFYEQGNTSTSGRYFVGYAGNDQSHNNMPPYYCCYLWLRIA